MNLAAMWTSFQDTLFLLALRRGILETLEYFSRESERRYPVPEEELAAARAAQEKGTFKMRPLEPESLEEKEIIRIGKQSTCYGDELIARSSVRSSFVG